MLEGSGGMARVGGREVVLDGSNVVNSGCLDSAAAGEVIVWEGLVAGLAFNDDVVALGVLRYQALALALASASSGFP